MFFCILLIFSTCSLDASAGEILKKVSITTKSKRADQDDCDLMIEADLGFSGDSVWDNNKYNAEITITPIYNSVWVRSGSERVNLATEPLILNLINEKTELCCIQNPDYFDPVYNKDGLVTSFSQTFSSVTASDLNYFSFMVMLPDESAIESLFSEYGEEIEIDSVQYSIKFKITASISLKSGSSPGVKLSKKQISGYIDEVYTFTEMVSNLQGNSKIVKAKSSNSSVASVSVSSGKIYLKKAGTCTITLTNGFGRSASFKVKVNSSTIKRRLSAVTCILGAEMNLDNQGVVGILGVPKYTVKSSNSSIVSVRKSLNQPVIRGKKTGSATLSFTCGKTKFSVRVRVVKARIVLASSATLAKGSSRSFSAEDSSDGIYIEKATSINGLLSLKLSSNARTLTVTANKSFSGTSATDKVNVTFNNGTKKTIKVKITQPKTTKKFSLKDIKIKLKRSYWNGSKACIEYTITNNSSRHLTKVRIFYSGIVNEEVCGYANINSSIPRDTSKTFITRVNVCDYLDGVTLKVVSAS